jgi:hypothetical protein
MRLVSFERAGKRGFGAVVGDGVVDLGIALGGRYADIKALLEGDGLEAAKAAVAGRAADDALADLVLAPVIPNPGKIWCCGLNYAEHVRETQREVTEKPMFFMRVADSQVGHGQAIPRPPESTQLDFEGEIAVIIGRRGRRIAEADAWSHIAGYACYNDGSVRDWQRHTAQFTPGKNFDASGSIGPELVPADAFGDYDDRLLFLEPRHLFPAEIEEGMGFEGLPEGCNPAAPKDRLYFVSDIYPDHVVMDGNHPLAGMALRVTLKVHAVREAQVSEVGKGSLGTGFFRMQVDAGDDSAPLLPPTLH